MAIHPSAIIADGANIADSASIGPWCVIGEQVSIGEGTVLHGNNYLDGNLTIGKNCQIYPFAVLGTPPQHTSFAGVDTETIIGDDNVIREYVVIHRAIERDDGITVIGNNNMFMLGTHIGHDCVLGSNIICAPHVLVGGHAIIENNVTLGGNCSVHQFARIGTQAMIGAGSYIRRDVIPYALVDNAEGLLAGLNIVGIKRSGKTKSDIINARHAYQQLFNQSTMEEGIAHLKAHDANCGLIQEILRFVSVPSKRHYARPANLQAQEG